MILIKMFEALSKKEKVLFGKEQARESVLKILDDLEKEAPREDGWTVPYSSLELVAELDWSTEKNKAKKLIEKVVQQSDLERKEDVVKGVKEIIKGLEYHSGVFKSQSPNFEEARRKIMELIN